MKNSKNDQKFKSLKNPGHEKSFVGSSLKMSKWWTSTDGGLLFPGHLLRLLEGSQVLTHTGPWARRLNLTHVVLRNFQFLKFWPFRKREPGLDISQQATVKPITYLECKSKLSSGSRKFCSALTSSSGVKIDLKLSKNGEGVETVKKLSKIVQIHYNNSIKY